MTVVYAIEVDKISKNLQQLLENRSADSWSGKKQKRSIKAEK